MITADQIAQHLSMSKRNAYEVIKTLGIDKQTATMQEVRSAYIEHLRAIAAGRGGSQQESLALAKTEEASVRTALNRLAYHEKLGTLVQADEVGRCLNDWAGYANREYRSGIVNLISKVEDEHNISVDGLTVENVVGPMMERIRDYAKKLSKSLIEKETG